MRFNLNIDSKEAVREGIEEGVSWKLLPGLNNTCINGYVKLPAHSEYAGFTDYFDLPFEVHGGLTYGDDNNWIGFDTKHHGDVWLDKALEVIGGTADYTMDSNTVHTFWNIDMLEQETRNLARQVSGFKDLK